MYGANLLLLVSVVLAMLLGLLLGAHPRHSFIVAACLSLSSSPLATRLIQSKPLVVSWWVALYEEWLVEVNKPLVVRGGVVVFIWGMVNCVHVAEYYVA